MPRDEQEHAQRRQQIIQGALQVFSAKGFDGASTRAIAEAAQIGSPGLIYHYFKDKADLLHQVLLERVPLISLIDPPDGTADLPPDELLPRFALGMSELLSKEHTVTILKVALVEAIRNPRVAELVNEVGPGRGLGLLAGYLERQMAAGRLRRMDPQIAVRLFIGPLLAHVMTRSIFAQAEGQAILPAEMARATAAAVLRELAPEPMDPASEPSGSTPKPAESAQDRANTTVPACHLPLSRAHRRSRR